jgi:hypothetical protein
MTGDFREPVIWLLLAIFARGITEIIAFVLPDQDLIKHSHAEAGAGHELSVIYGRLGQHLPSPDQDPVKRPDNYLGRILATIFTLGIYMFWWSYNQMDEPNKHFTSNWAQENHLLDAVDPISCAIRGTQATAAGGLTHCRPRPRGPLPSRGRGQRAARLPTLYLPHARQPIFTRSARKAEERKSSVCQIATGKVANHHRTECSTGSA